MFPHLWFSSLNKSLYKMVAIKWSHCWSMENNVTCTTFMYILQFPVNYIPFFQTFNWCSLVTIIVEKLPLEYSMKDNDYIISLLKNLYTLVLQIWKIAAAVDYKGINLWNKRPNVKMTSHSLFLYRRKMKSWQDWIATKDNLRTPIGD